MLLKKQQPAIHPQCDGRKVEQAYLTNDVHRWLDDSVRPDHLMVIRFINTFFLMVCGFMFAYLVLVIGFFFQFQFILLVKVRVSVIVNRFLV